LSVKKETQTTNYSMKNKHSFHIPVMGVAYTIDTPLKVSQYGIDSVISLVDNVLLEMLRKMYSKKFEIPYQEISEKAEDFRAKRITSYLNLIHDLAEKKFSEFKTNTEEKIAEIKDYFDLLPNTSTLKDEFKELITSNVDFNEVKSWLKKHLTMGSIDVNIMTKVDKENYQNGEKLSSEFNDAHAALRGYANSKLQSSLILSAGMSPRLYGYIENFKDFYPDENGGIKKKIVLKVSDYRSALIQGKFLAKKGLWVSEYRVESGLNCGGHTFATDGYLLGPILEEFRIHRQELSETVHEIFIKALENKSKPVPKQILPLKVTAQGGVGTAEEHEFLLDHYQVDSIGWGTPFLLVPEATTVDDDTINKLAKSQEKDLYLSNISPLGVPFNSLRNSSGTLKKLERAQKGREGSSCPKEYLVSNTEFSEKPICTASRLYQHQKLKELNDLNLPNDDYQTQYDKIIAPECLCVGLSEPAVKTHDLDYKIKDFGTTVCPGPNMAYFSKIMSLKEMVGHIYGKVNIINKGYRPNMFVKELNMYIDVLNDKIKETKNIIDKRQEKYLSTFARNLNDGISYYQKLFSGVKDRFTDKKSTICKDLEASKQNLKQLFQKLEKLSIEK